MVAHCRWPLGFLPLRVGGKKPWPLDHGSSSFVLARIYFAATSCISGIHDCSFECTFELDFFCYFSTGF